MATSVWKFPIPIQDEFTIEMPAGSQLLHFRTQHDRPALWALVNPDKILVAHQFRLAGTGHQIDIPPDEALSYVGTCFLDKGALVFHLFEIVDTGL